MSDAYDEPIKKLSEAITENNEIINDANILIKEMKGVKTVNDETCEKYKRRVVELIEDFDEIIEVIDGCKQEDDPTFKSFDSKKKSAKSSTDKSKKQLLDTLSKLEKSLEKTKETEGKKNKGILKTGSKLEDTAANDKNQEKNKLKDTDTLSAKSLAGSSANGDLEEIASDVEDENKDKKDKKEKGTEKKVEHPDGKDSKEKKKGKDKANKGDKDDNENDKKEKKNKSKIKSADSKEKLNDNRSEVSFSVEDIDDNENNNLKKTKDKEEKKMKDNEISVSDGDDKEKLKKDKKKDKGKKIEDTESLSVPNKESLTDAVEEDTTKTNKKDELKSKKNKDKKDKDKLKNKKEKEKTTADAESNDEKNGELLIESKNKKNEEKNKKSKKDKNGNAEDTQSVGSNVVESLEPEKKKKDKKKNKEKDKSTEDINSVHDKNEDSLTKDKKNKDKKKDKTTEDNGKSSDNKKKVDKKKIDEEVISKSQKPLENSAKSDIESDKEIGTPSLRTQESLRSESDYYEDFESDDELKNQESVVAKKTTPVESKAPESNTKSMSSLQRQQLVDSDEGERSATSKTEGELHASTKFENVDGFYVVTKPFKAEGEEDLNGRVGEQFTILEINDDGWWLARNENGDEGFVPLSCIKPNKESRDLMQTDSLQDTPTEMIVSKEVKTEFKEPEHDDGPPKRGKEMWDQIRETMKEKGLTDVLKAFGALPIGFRFSTLAIWSSKSHKECSMKVHLYPKLSDSDLSFRDLQHDAVEHKIRPRPVRIQRIVQIVKSFQMAAVSSKFIVKSRHVRMCLFNGEKAISNIHVMCASVNEKDLKIWNFNSKITDSTNSLDFNEIFIRTNNSSTEVSFLLEFCMLGFKSKFTGSLSAPGQEPENTTKKGVKVTEEFTDDELVEFSCGWVKIPLYDENGQLITSKNADYELFGGTPYEEGLEVDPTIGRTAAGSKLKSMLSQSKQPQVSIRIAMPGKDHKDLMETLPDEIIGSTLHLTVLSYYRRILSQELMDRRQNLTSAEPIYSPFLVSFQEISNQSDLLDVIRTVWIEKMKSLKNLDKKDYEKMNKIFQDTYIEYIYPLSKLTSLPQSQLARRDMEQARAVKIKEFIQRVKTDTLSVLLSGDYSYAPLSFEEFSYKVVSKYSKAVKV